MGRRALRPIDPALDLSGHLRALAELPAPFQQAELFGRIAPLEVEVGSGKGLFLATAAAAHPDKDYLGLEIGFKYARFTAARFAKQGLANVRIVHGDALRFFREWLPSESIAAVHVYFPDPWWKARHKKRRVMNQAFVRDVERVLLPGGALHFWTDVEEYFQTTLELIPSVSNLAGTLPVPQSPAEHDLDYRTHFERRTRLAEEPVYRAEFKKPAIQ